MIPYIGRDAVDKNTVMYSNRMIVFRNELVFHVDKCIDCGLCLPTCPKLAIFEPTEDDIKKKLTGPVEVNTELCIFCGICDYLCPTGAFEFTTNKKRGLMLRDNGSLPSLKRNKSLTSNDGVMINGYLKGTIILNADKVPKDVDLVASCPTGVFAMEGGKVVVKNEENCFYCYACTRECTVEEALSVKRTQILYEVEEEFSSPFSEIVKILISPIGKAKQLKEHGQRKSVDRLKELYSKKYIMEDHKPGEKPLGHKIKVLKADKLRDNVTEYEEKVV